MSTSLFDNFPPISAEDWRAKVAQDLKGKPFDKLVWRTGEGFDLQPFYRQEDTPKGIESADFTPRRGTSFNLQDSGWQVVQPLMAHDPEVGQRIEELAGTEVHALWLHRHIATPPTQSLTEMLGLLNLEQTALHLDWQEAPSLIAADLYMQLAQQRISHQLLTGTLINDPIAAALAQGNAPTHLSLVNVEAGVSAFQDSPWFRGVGLDVRYVQAQGGTLVQQVAFALATLVEYLDFLEKSESSVSQVDLLKHLAITFPVGTSFFLEMAKFRAFRQLYSQVLSAYGLDEEEETAPFIMGYVSDWTYTHYDAYNNLLRATTSAMSAIMGGVQSLIIPPFDSLQRRGNATSARLSRNIQHLLRHESYLDHVKDPAGGSYYVEHATEALAQAAWELFQQIEGKGGLLKMAESGEVFSLLAEARAAKAKNMTTRKTTQVGVNQYAHPQETLPELQVADEDLRASAPYERIRTEADRISTARGSRLSAFLLTFGEVKMRNARSQFARNLISAGGFDVQETQHLNDLEAALNEAIELRPEVLVLCSSDADYTEQAASIAARLRADAPGTYLILAGKPEGWENWGIDASIAARIDALAFLQGLVERFV